MRALRCGWRREACASQNRPNLLKALHASKLSRVSSFNYTRGTTLTFGVRVWSTQKHTRPIQTLTPKGRVRKWLGYPSTYADYGPYHLQLNQRGASQHSVSDFWWSILSVADHTNNGDIHPICHDGSITARAKNLLLVDKLNDTSINTHPCLLLISLPADQLLSSLSVFSL